VDGQAKFNLNPMCIFGDESCGRAVKQDLSIVRSFDVPRAKKAGIKLSYLV